MPLEWFFYMKRLALVLVLALAVTALGGCRFAVVEDDPVQIGFGGAALAEEAVLSLGSRDWDDDTAVQTLQARLKELGYLSGRADGIFGDGTKSALAKFQKDSAIEATGSLDEATRIALYPEYQAMTEARDASLRTLKHVGGTMDEVLARLAQYGFMTETGGEDYDMAVHEALVRFEEYAVAHYGTEFDDPIPLKEETLVPSEETLPPEVRPTATPKSRWGRDAAIPEMDAPTPEPTLRPEHATDGVVTGDLYTYLIADRFPVYRETVQAGDYGEEVRRVENRLFALQFQYETPNDDFNPMTTEALKAFQRVNGLQATGIADAETQRRLFGADTAANEAVDQPFYIKVSIDEQKVRVLRWCDGAYSYVVKEMVCSTGLPGNDTITGVFTSPGHRDGRWHYFTEHHCWAQYAFTIRGPYLFHSVIFSDKDERTLRRSSLDALGRRASHGCVRLMVQDAKWIYEHCGKGQVIEVA